MTDAAATELHTSPLDAVHRASGARMVPFGGWTMPIQYASVLDEHKACRDDAVVFDVSHLGTLAVHGPGAHEVLQRAFTNDLDRIGPGRAQYTHLLDAADGHVVDDIIVWWVSRDEFAVMPNASNTDALTVALDAVRDDGACAIADVTSSRAVLAVQGPNARARLVTIDPALAAPGRFAVEAGEWRGHAITVAGTGYTGEDGVEIQIGAAAAEGLWDAVVAAGVCPAGLGARDTLRLEAGLPLHGHELGPGITPLQAGLAWVVRFDKGDFLGRDALLAERDRGVSRRLRGVLGTSRQPFREGCALRHADEEIGVLTSGNQSPVLGRGIGLGFVPPDLPLGTEIEVDVRGRAVTATVVDPPFVRR